MTDTSADCKVDIEVQIARLDKKIEQVKHEITCWQDELDDLEAERADLFEKLSNELTSRKWGNEEAALAGRT